LNGKFSNLDWHAKEDFKTFTNQITFMKKEIEKVLTIGE
jgi:hypothetical protein